MDKMLLTVESTPVLPTTVLLNVATDRPAALLLVDAVSRRVVQANALAQQFTPALVLPVSVDVWAAAAGLRDASGAVLAGSDDGSWLALDSQAGPGRSVTVGPLFGPDAEAGRRSFFALEMPVEGAPGSPSHVSVVFLPLHPMGLPMAVSAQPEQPVHALSDPADLLVGCSFVLVSATEPGLPLTWVNAAFTETTGYLPEEVIGRNCRLLQGPGTDPDQIARLREAVAAGLDVTVVLLNYRKDGTAFRNQVSISPVRDPSGAITHFFGVQTDVTDQAEADRARVSVLTAERSARTDADSARRQAHVLGLRMALVAEATGLLASTMNVDDSLDRLAELAVPLLADWVVLTLTDESGRLVSRTILRHRDGQQELLARYRTLMPDLADPSTVMFDVLAGGPATLTSRWVVPPVQQMSADERELLQIELALGSISRVLVPLTAQRRVVGTMMLVHGPSGRIFDESDLSMAADLGMRAGLAIDNARLYTREQATAVALQRSLLPSLPVIDGLDLAAEYLPAGEGSQVGGDWWDVFVLPDGTIGLAVGDVMGHDIAAAAAMGQLRSVLRACAWASTEPAEVLTQLDALVQSFELAQLATCFYARLEPAIAGPGKRRPARLSWSNAGHLPPILLDPSGTARLLQYGADVPIGVPFGGPRQQQSVLLAPGSTLLLYTDGLVETRAGDIESDLQRLLTEVGRRNPADRSRQLIDHLVAGLPQLTDDVALLAARLLP